MLIFVSDMHLTDQTLAPSVPLDALSRLTEEVKQVAKKAQTVELILLGDIFDVLRSSRWLVKVSGKTFLYTPVSIRPWSAIDTPIERVVSTILEGIKNSYEIFFKEIRQIENVKLSWVPGNHDRLVKMTQQGRQFLKDIGVQMVDYEILREDYGVFARHGHYFDKYNIRGKNYKLAPFGDAVVIEILNKLQVEVAKKCKIVHFNHPDIAFLGAMEYLRPHANVPIWIHKMTEKLPDKLLKNRTREAWRNVVDSFKECEMLGILPSKEKTFLRPLLNLLNKSKNFRKPINRLLRIFEKLVEKPGKYKKHASAEPALSNPCIRYVVYGHTHIPGKYQLKNNKYYVNTGCWERSYKSLSIEKTPFMRDFYILIIDKDQDEPELKQIPINSPITWKPPYKKPTLPAVSFKGAQEVEMSDMKEAMFEKGLIDLFTGASGIKVKALINPQKQGFDMVIHNKIKPTIFGRNVAVEIKHRIKIPDIDTLATNVKKAGVDGGWIFSLEKVSDVAKAKAKDLKITIFDIADVNKFRTGASFTSLLGSYKVPGTKF